MIEIAKNIALSIAVIGLGLAVLLPAMISVFQTAGINSYYEKNIFINVGWLLVVTLATILYVAYYVAAFYLIWW
ncbi:hypothetical protein DQT32_04780 [Salmonella enterica subsp. enterica serovar Braenderup]|nr:hypothetical protein [Salmonella enterica subsp. enterica serovar Braenderup]